MKFSCLPKNQIDRVFNQKYCDIDNEFFGFTDIYESLAKIIPKHFAVVDLGCAYNPQCVLFREHKSFTAVDLPGVDGSKLERFTQDNCMIFEMSIQQFISENIHRFNLKETFAICSYVGSESMKIVQDNFKNIFTYYPHGGFDDVYKKMATVLTSNNPKNPTHFLE